jgi:hypothetical protein
VWNKLNQMHFHAFRRALSIEMMQNTHDEENGVQDSNSEPRQSPRQTTANNHEYGVVSLILTFFERVAEVRDSPNS